MSSPETSAGARRSHNPRRRQRNASEDSLAVRQPVKRRKRTGLSKETFETPASKKINGHTDPKEEVPMMNGHAHPPKSLRPNGVDKTSLAFRKRDDEKSENYRRPSRRNSDISLTKNENYAITKFSTSPQTLEEPRVSEPWQAEISSQLGYAVAMTHTQAIVWRYAQGPSTFEHPQATRIRLLHPTTSIRQPLPLGLLVPTSVEPALLIMMPTSGKITYWESLSNAASVDPNRQKQKSVQDAVQGMMSGEVATKLTETEPRGFIITFSTGRLAHLCITDIQGRSSLNINFLNSGGVQSGGIFGSLKGVFTGAGWRRDIAAVRAGRSIHRGQRYVTVAMARGRFQVWDLKWNGTHSLAYDVDGRAEILKALLEGGEVFHDQQEHEFEVLDVALLSHGSHGREIARPNATGDCQLLALTVLKGSEASKYALVGLSLVNNSVTIDVVHPIKCYRSSLPATSQHRPQVLVSEPAQVANIIFEESVVFVSLGEIEESPSSQLQLEAHTLPDPFQDVVTFRKDRAYRVVGCASESHASSDQSSAHVIAIFGYGMIRIAIPVAKAGQSVSVRATVTAQTKIEQAVFHGSSQQDLLDFSPRPETSFSRNDVESAALRISKAVGSSTSSYLASLTPNMEQQLSVRATALADLIKHLQEYYPRLRSTARWQLLWDAERMAAAQALWRWYNETVSNPDNGQKDLFAEMVEAIPENLKLQNEPTQGETDGVRHWFIHDVWRLEWAIPYSHEIVEILFKESVEDRREFDAFTKAKMVLDASGIQLTTLEAAYKFRQENAALYGFGKERLVDGYLQYMKDYQGIPEIWTSSSLGQVVALTLHRVKELVEITREMAKLLAIELEEHLERADENALLEDEINPERTQELMNKLRDHLVRQVEICCRIFIERFRWLLSREDAQSKREGEALTELHVDLRRQQFVDLTDLNLAEQGIALAEKYWELDAILDIFEREKDNDEADSIKPSIPGRIKRYFIKFGDDWADTYFKRYLDDGKSAVEILNDDRKYKPYLTKFLRSDTDYANMAWINEVSVERNYAVAATHLEKAAKESDDPWAQRIMLSISKLSVMAAQNKNQMKTSSAEATMLRTNGRLALLNIQERLRDHFIPIIRTALDADAGIKMLMDHYGVNAVEHRPSFQRLLKQDLEALLARQTLEPHDIIDTLTLMHTESTEAGTTSIVLTRFFLALKVLKLSSAVSDGSTSPQAISLMARLIWRRVLIASDWTVLNRTETKDDAHVFTETAGTALFQTLLEGYRIHHGTDDASFWDSFPPVVPSAVIGAGTIVEELRSLPQYSQMSDEQLADLAHDFGVEDDLLQKHMDEGRLEEWFKGVLESAKTAAREDADQDGEEGARRAEAAQAFNGKMANRDRDKFGIGDIVIAQDDDVQELEIDGEDDADMAT